MDRPTHSPTPGPDASARDAPCEPGPVGAATTIVALAPSGVERVRLKLDDGTRLRLPAQEALRLNLAVGKSLTAAQREQLQTIAVRDALRAAALRLLGRREHGRRELARKVSARLPYPAELEAVLDELEAHGLLSDARYAESLVRHRMRHSLHGPHRVYRELLHHGLAPELAVAAVGVEAHAQDWLEAARRRLALELRRGTGRGESGAMRLRAALLRQGFPGPLIARALAERQPED